MNDEINQTLQRHAAQLAQQAEQINRLIPEIHLFAKEVRDNTIQTVRHMDKLDNVAAAQIKLESKLDQLDSQVDKLNLVVEGHKPVIAAINSLAQKVIWFSISAALASVTTVAVLGYAVLGKGQGG